MKRKCLFISLACIAVGLTAFSGAFAVCIERRCYEGNDRIDCQRARWEYDDCVKEEKAEKEARRAAAEREEREKAEKEAVKESGESPKKPQYPFMEDIREINKKDRRY